MTDLGKYESGTRFNVDINKLIASRLLVMASSGGGKSWLLRKIIEQVYGQVQIMVIDIEGEFGTLREKYDFVIAGKGKDVTADPRYAHTLARKALDLKIDLICDLYELKQHDRIRFVRLFLESMVNAPKALWHPVLIILDEAHIFAPEKGSAESLNAVIDIESRGRKRGFCLVPATQRLSKLHKDVAAECQNKLIGLANIELDRKRGAEELGFTNKADTLSLRDMNPGEFYAVGPAFGRGVERVRIGKVKTSHPNSDTAQLKVHAPAPTAKVKKALAKLADIPQEAEQEIENIKTLKATIRTLGRERNASSASPAQLEKAHAHGVAVAEKEFLVRLDVIKGIYKANFDIVAKAAQSVLDASKGFGKVKAAIDAVVKQSKIPIKKPSYTIPPAILNAVQPIVPNTPAVEISDIKLGPCAKAIIGFLAAQRGKSFTKNQVATMAGYANSGSFNNTLSQLSTAGLIIRDGKLITLQMGLDVTGMIDAGAAHTLDDWIKKLSKCEATVYALLLENGADTHYPKTALADTTGYANSGSFNNSLSRLSTLGLLKRHPDGTVGLNPEIENL